MVGALGRVRRFLQAAQVRCPEGARQQIVGSMGGSGRVWVGSDPTR